MNEFVIKQPRLAKSLHLMKISVQNTIEGYAAHHIQEIARLTASDNDFNRSTNKDYKSLKTVASLGGLGPDCANERHRQKVGRLVKVTQIFVLTARIV